MTAFILVFSNPFEGRDEEYIEWYNKVHLGEVSATEGIRSAQHFTLAEKQLTDNEQPWKYLAIYEVDEGVGVEQTLGNMLTNAPAMNMSDSIDVDNSFVSVMKSTGEVVQ